MLLNTDDKVNPMQRPVLRAASSIRGFGAPSATANLAVYARSADIERVIASMQGRPAILDTASGLRIELTFAPRKRGTGSAIEFTVREDSIVATNGKGTFSFIAGDQRLQFTADIARGVGHTIVASFPTALRA